MTDPARAVRDHRAMDGDSERAAVPPDYDRDPERFRTARAVLRRHAVATALPFAEAAFGSVALLYVLYHLRDPGRALAEARRVLRPGGLLAVAVPSRHDSPALAHGLPRTPLTFDAELAPSAIGALFADVEVERWDAPLLRLPARADVRDYLVGKGVAGERAAQVAATTDVP